MRPRAVFPMVGDCVTVCASDVELCERTGDGVKAGCEDGDINFDEALRKRVKQRAIYYLPSLF